MLPMEAVRKASGFLFYVAGILLIAGLVLVKRGILPTLSPYMHVFDLPILFIAMLYAGSSLYCSLARGTTSLPLLMAVFIPIGVLFAVFCWFNFGQPFPAF